MSLPEGYKSSFPPDGPDTANALERTTPGAPDPTILEDVRAFICRFVVLNEHQADAVVLWVAHTHAIDSFGCTPYLAITSPEKRSGKTRLLEVLELLSREPLSTANISDAALFRVIDARQPTLLVDEVDAVFGKRSPREELRGMLNAGYRRGATIAWVVRTTPRCRPSRSSALKRSPASGTASRTRSRIARSRSA